MTTRLCALLLLLAMAPPARGQAPLEHAATLYVDSAGQVYTRADQPAYFFLRSATHGGALAPIPSADPQAQPMHWDGHGPHYIVHRDLHLDQNIRFRVLADGVPPVSRIEHLQGVLFTLDTLVYAQQGARFALSAADLMSGVQGIYYSLNGAPYVRYGQPLAMDAEGKHRLALYAVDRVGNAEAPRAYTLITTRDARVRMDNIYFELNSARLKPSVTRELDRLAQMLRAYPLVRLEIQAHTDARGGERFNLMLSQRRANAVVNHLALRGIPLARLTATGLGFSQPVNECGPGVFCTEEQHRLNRRVELVITQTQAQTPE